MDCPPAGHLVRLGPHSHACIDAAGEGGIWRVADFNADKKRTKRGQNADKKRTKRGQNADTSRARDPIYDRDRDRDRTRTTPAACVRDRTAQPTGGDPHQGGRDEADGGHDLGSAGGNSADHLPDLGGAGDLPALLAGHQRAIGALAGAEVLTPGRLTELTRRELLALPGVGKATADHVERCLQAHGLALAEPPPPPPKAPTMDREVTDLWCRVYQEEMGQAWPSTLWRLGPGGPDRRRSLQYRRQAGSLEALERAMRWYLQHHQQVHVRRVPTFARLGWGLADGLLADSSSVSTGHDGTWAGGEPDLEEGQAALERLRAQGRV